MEHWNRSLYLFNFLSSVNHPHGDNRTSTSTDNLQFNNKHSFLWISKSHFVFDKLTYRITALTSGFTDPYGITSIVVYNIQFCNEKYVTQKNKIVLWFPMPKYIYRIQRTNVDLKVLIIRERQHEITFAVFMERYGPFIFKYLLKIDK